MRLLAAFALFNNLLLAVFAFFVFPTEFSEASSHCLFSGQLAILAGAVRLTAPLGCAVSNCYGIALIGSGAAVATVIIFAFHRISAGATLVALIIHGGALLFVFAGIYFGFGLMHGDTEVFMHGNTALTTLHRQDALYFSIVTWTTLGYGDFAPRAAIRLVAGLQALLGYVFFGLIVGLLADYLKNRAAGI